MQHGSTSLTTMQIWLAGPLLAGTAQGSRHLIELFVAFGLTSLIGLERTIQGKVAGLRTQTIVGTSSALILLISKYGFGDVLSAQTIVLDPSRVAAQIVSGIGFLGAGIIITRRGAVHGLTTAAAVWESAAIGMAAGAGLLLLAIAVVALHFVSALAFNVVERQLTARVRGAVRLHIIYDNGKGVLRTILRVCGQRNWQLTELDADDHGIDRDQVGVTMTLSGSGISNAAQVLAEVDGVSAVLPAEEEPD
jgi:putative Mg2+ transporter-C (MgtC) family protein